MLSTALSSAALLGSGVTCGVFVAVAVSILPALRDLANDRYVETHQLLGRNWDPLMPIVVLATTACDAALGGLHLPGPAGVLGILAAALMLGSAGISHLLNVPINRRVKGTSPSAALEPGWDDPRPEWSRWHRLRTAVALAAFGINIAMAMTL